METYRSYTVVGWFLIIFGAIFLLLPYVIRVIPNTEKLPWYIIYVYRRDGFYFATSPILIFISILSFVLSYWNRR